MRGGEQRYSRMVRPPSTDRIWPVIQPDSADRRRTSRAGSIWSGRATSSSRAATSILARAARRTGTQGARRRRRDRGVDERAVLPPQLRQLRTARCGLRDPSANGRGNELFYDWQFSGDNEDGLRGVAGLGRPAISPTFRQNDCAGQSIHRFCPVSSVGGLASRVSSRAARAQSSLAATASVARYWGGRSGIGNPSRLDEAGVQLTPNQD